MENVVFTSGKWLKRKRLFSRSGDTLMFKLWGNMKLFFFYPIPHSLPLLVGEGTPACSVVRGGGYNVRHKING
jgi:hypothetical protein